MQQIIATPSTKKVSEIYTRVKEGTLVLQPAFQRRFVWNSIHKEKFIDTLLSGYPTPEIYISQSGIDIEKIEAVEVVVDGQQRLSTIIEYIDEAEDSQVYGNNVPKYKRLTADQKKDFLGYLLIFRDLGDITPEQIKEVFKRINSTQYSLNSIELHNAIYDGTYISVAKEILKLIDAEKMPFLSESQISRMDDLYFILLIMSTIEEGGYFAGDKLIEKMIAQYNEKYSQSDKVKQNILSTFTFIDKLNLDSDSIWLKKSCFFTMFIELYKSLSSLFGQESKVRELLIEIEGKVLNNKTNDTNTNIYANFYSNIYTGTNSRKARIIRAEFFQNEVLRKIIS